MKTKGILLLFVVFFFVGCESDIEIFHQDEPTPVVYCILNPEEDNQYLRLSRTYISYDATKPPDDADSILYPFSTQAKIEEVENGIVVNQSTFHPQEVVKDSGFFPSQIHWIYTSSMKIYPDKEYRLIIYSDKYDRIVFSTCKTLSSFKIIDPYYPEVRDIHFQNDHNPMFAWTNSKNAGIYQIGIVIHYDETIGMVTERKSLPIYLNWIYQNSDFDQTLYSSISSTQFYLRIKEGIEINQYAQRTLKSIDVFVNAGGEEIAFLSKIQLTGQTFSLMEYTNILNGVGVFSSQYKQQVSGFKVTDQTLDSLAYGQHTFELNFTDRTGSRRY